VCVIFSDNTTVLSRHSHTASRVCVIFSDNTTVLSRHSHTASRVCVIFSDNTTVLSRHSHTASRVCVIFSDNTTVLSRHSHTASRFPNYEQNTELQCSVMNEAQHYFKQYNDTYTNMQNVSFHFLCNMHYEFSQCLSRRFITDHA